MFASSLARFPHDLIVPRPNLFLLPGGGVRRSLLSSGNVLVVHVALEEINSLVCLFFFGMLGFFSSQLLESSDKNIPDTAHFPYLICIRIKFLLSFSMLSDRACSHLLRHAQVYGSWPSAFQGIEFSLKMNFMQDTHRKPSLFYFASLL